VRRWEWERGVLEPGDKRARGDGRVITKQRSGSLEGRTQGWRIGGELKLEGGTGREVKNPKIKEKQMTHLQKKTSLQVRQ